MAVAACGSHLRQDGEASPGPVASVGREKTPYMLLRSLHCDTAQTDPGQVRRAPVSVSRSASDVDFVVLRRYCFARHTHADG